MALGALLERHNQSFAQQRTAARFGGITPSSSCEETVYTVETTLTSIQKEDDRRKIRSKKKRNANQNRRTKRVHFSKIASRPENADLECSTMVIERFEDPTLWYSRTEIKQMRQEGMMTAYTTNREHQSDYALAALKVLKPGEGKEQSRENGRQFMKLLSLCADLRGLEPFMAPQINLVVKSQITSTLEVQAKTKDAAQIRLEARKVSKRCAKMARQMATHDTKEALRANFSVWKPEPKQA